MVQSAPDQPRWKEGRSPPEKLATSIRLPVWGGLVGGAVLCIAAAIAFHDRLGSPVSRRTAPPPSASGAAPAASPTQRAALIAALRQKVKHVFVIFQENESFDEYFGTFPGAENLASPQARKHGFRQYDPIGHQWVTPFRITDPDIASPLQSRDALISAINGGAMDNFVGTDQQFAVKAKMSNSDAQNMGLVTMAHYDCDTLPYLWLYASRFTLYDHIFEAFTGPSTPNNISVIAAQEGQSQAARFPGDQEHEQSIGDEIYHDYDPAFGPYAVQNSKSTHYARIAKKTQINQRYATLMLTLTGKRNREATADVDDLQQDMTFVIARNQASVPWGWYQEGYNGPKKAADVGYVAHHNAPQYFGYLRHNDIYWRNEHNTPDMLAALKAGSLPARGVFYVKGSNRNQFGWRPASRDKIIHEYSLGDDDHPGVGNSNRQVAEAFVAKFVSAIARSKYWADSAIIVTWDDPGGFYDHVPPPNFERCRDGRPCGDGPRVPLILISPFAKVGIAQGAGDLNSLVIFVNTLFDLPPLASLPDERRTAPNGPRDANPRLSDLTEGFDLQRLIGRKPAIDASRAAISDKLISRFPPPMNCQSLGISPVKIPGEEHPPRGFNSRIMGEDAFLLPHLRH